VRAGLLSRERESDRGADVVLDTEGNMGCAITRALSQPRAVEEPGTQGTSLYENREIPWPPTADGAVGRNGKPKGRSRR